MQQIHQHRKRCGSVSRTAERERIDSFTSVHIWLTATHTHTHTHMEAARRGCTSYPRPGPTGELHCGHRTPSLTRSDGIMYCLIDAVSDVNVDTNGRHVSDEPTTSREVSCPPIFPRVFINLLALCLHYPFRYKIFINLY